MTTVLLSIHEEYWNMIKSGKKIKEIRKTAPKKCTYPIRVVCYVTGGKGVVGDFICPGYVDTDFYPSLVKYSCLDMLQLNHYGKNKKLYGWCIENVREYKNTLALEQLMVDRAPQSWCYLPQFC